MESTERGRRATPSLSVVVAITSILLIAACDQNPVSTDPESNPRLAGVVTNIVTEEPVVGGYVSIGTDTVRTGLDGRYEFTTNKPGSATIRCAGAGYKEFVEEIVLPPEGMAFNIRLDRIERFRFGDFALYVPGVVSRVRGVIVALGGPDTRGFTGAPFDADLPELETALQEAGKAMRTLAGETGLAILGTSRTRMASSTETDQLIINMLEQAAVLSGRPEIADVPRILYGLSGGAPEASGFVMRNPEAVIGLFFKVPVGVDVAESSETAGIPTFIVLAEQDASVDNIAIMQSFEASRSAGALWGLALEPGVPHLSLSAAQRALTVQWMRDVVARRLPGETEAHELIALAESDGWLGDMTTGAIIPHGESYDGDPSAVSWFPSQKIADAWQDFALLPTPSSGGLGEGL